MAEDGEEWARGEVLEVLGFFRFSCHAMKCCSIDVMGGMKSGVIARERGD
jgi:hypothetical protein